MGQDDIYNLLREKNKWMNSKDIANELGISQRSVIKALFRMAKHDETLEAKPRAQKDGGYLWRVKKDEEI